jgi:PadR family transcriptional regulator PadR
MADTDIAAKDLQKGSAGMIVLALLEDRQRHGYELAQLIETQSGSRLQFHVSSLYPLLYRLERKGLVEGKWVEKSGERRRRFYRLTPAGRRALAAQRRTWREFVSALHSLTGFNHA